MTEGGRVEAPARGGDFRVRDPSLAGAGRLEIGLAEREMPGLMALRAELSGSRPLAGLRVVGCLHMTVQTAVLIETLTALGADVRWSSCNVFSTQDAAAAAVAAAGVPVFAWRGMTEEDYWRCIDESLDAPDGRGPDLAVDDGGDLTRVLHSPERAGMLAGLRGVSEETTTGVMRLEEMAREGRLGCPAVNVNDSVTKSKFDNRYGCRESLVDGVRRATDLMLSGKVAMVCGFGDVGKGSAESLARAGCRVMVSEVDPICALQAAVQGYEVATMEEAAPRADVFVTATGGRDAIRIEHMREMKDGAVVCNIGHFDNEIQVDALRNLRWTSLKPQVDLVEMPGGRRIVLLSEGRLVNLGNATGHPSFVMSASFTNQVLAQLELARGAFGTEPAVHVLPKRLDERVAELHLAHLGARLTRLTAEQADYLGVPPEGPFKKDSYRYLGAPPRPAAPPPRGVRSRPARRRRGTWSR